MHPENAPLPPVTFASKWLAYGVHVYTASGLVFAALAMLEVCKAQPDPRWVFAWIVVAVFVDATDGTLARRAKVKHNAPWIDGRTIDDIVDFLTFTFIPLLLVVKMGWVPEPGIWYVAPALVASVLGFANVGAKDEGGGFFLGFPSYWNIVAFYLGYSASIAGGWLNVAILWFFAALTFAPIGFVYPTLAPKRTKGVVIAGGVMWTLVTASMLTTYPVAPSWMLWFSLSFPAIYTIISLLEYRSHTRGA